MIDKVFALSPYALAVASGSEQYSHALFNSCLSLNDRN